jgi:hypothetical protein
MRKRLARSRGFQHRGTAALAHDRVAERPTESIEEASAGEEAADGLWLAIENLIHEIVDNKAVVPREVGDEPRSVRASLDRQRGELEGRNPAFCALRKSHDLAARKIEPHRAIEVGGGLVTRKPEIGRANLDDLTANSQPRERKGRIRPGADHDVDIIRDVLDQECETLMDLPAVDNVVVVEYEGEVFRGRGKLVDQSCKERLEGALPQLEDRHEGCADPLNCRLQRSDHMRPEGNLFVVCRIEREPCYRCAFHHGQMLGQQRCLAEAGRSRDQDQFGSAASLQAGADRGSLYSVGSASGRVQLGRDQGTGHNGMRHSGSLRAPSSPSSWYRASPSGPATQWSKGRAVALPL